MKRPTVDLEGAQSAAPGPAAAQALIRDSSGVRPDEDAAALIRGPDERSQLLERVASR